jgi:ferrous iron transport protein A
MRHLNELKPGESGKIARLEGAGALKRRIMDMGLTKGTEIRVTKVAPLGDPIELTVRGYELSIRKDEAATIEIAD